MCPRKFSRTGIVRRYFLLLIVTCFKEWHVVSAGFWDDWFEPSKEPADCSFTTWGQWGDCEPINSGSYVYTHRRIREMSEPQNGGASCSPAEILNQTERCSVTETLVDKFMSQLHSSAKQSFDRQKSGVFRSRNIDTMKRLGRCREWRDINNTLIMGGGDCSATRRARRDPSINLGGVLRRTRRGATKTIRNRDLLFLLDESGSVGPKRFETVKEIAASITSKLCKTARVASDRTRVSVASFDAQNHPHIYFNNDHMDEPAQLVEKIRRIPYSGNTEGSTYLAAALTYAKTDMFIASRGVRLDSSGNVQLVVLITDGCASGRGDLSSVASQLYDDNISILAIGIGSNEECHRKVMELSNDSMCWQFFGLKTWTDAENFAKDVKTKECKTTWTGLGRSC